MKQNKWAYAGTFGVAVALLAAPACCLISGGNDASNQVAEGVVYDYTPISAPGYPLSITTMSGKVAAIPTNTVGVLIIPSALTQWKFAVPGEEQTPVKEIGPYAFYSCNGLTAAVIPEGIKKIGYGAFYGCGNLKSVVIPDSVTNIESEAFYRCSSLSSVSMGSGVEVIKRAAFRGCDNLETIVIPSSLTNIGERVFGVWNDPIEIREHIAKTGGMGEVRGKRRGLQAFEVAPGNPKFSSIDGVLFDKTGKLLIAYPYGRKGGYKVPEGVEVIGEDAFRACAGLTSIKMAKSVKEIKRYAFLECSNLTSVVMGEGIEAIDIAAFARCNRLPSITLPPNLNLLYTDAFAECDNLKSILAHSKNERYVSIDGVLVNKKGNGVYVYPCAKQGDYTVADGSKFISAGAFDGADGLTSINLPASLETLGSPGMFARCRNLNAINVDTNSSHFSSVDGVLFDKGGGSLLAYPPAKQGAYAIPNSVSNVPLWALAGCHGLTSVTIPAGLKWIGHEPFTRCDNLTAISVDADNPNYVSVDGVLFDKKEMRLIRYPAAKQGTVYVMPEGSTLRWWGGDPFENCTNLKELTIAASVTDMNTLQLKGCSNLTSITFPARETSFKYMLPDCFWKINKLCLRGGEWKHKIIFDHMFSGFVGLTEVTIPEGIRSIWDRAFEDCINLQTVNLPASIERLEPGTFFTCTNITSVVIPACVTNLQETFPLSYQKITNVVRHAAIPPQDKQPTIQTLPQRIVPRHPSSRGKQSAGQTSPQRIVPRQPSNTEK